MTTREDSINEIRRFNRHYVPAMRLLDRSYLDTGWSTIEAAVFLEIGEAEGCSARDIAQFLHVDKGYLSRTIRGFVDEGLVSRRASEEDARLQVLTLTDAGRRRADELTAAGERIVSDAFPDTSDTELARVAEALSFVLDAMGQGERS